MEEERNREWRKEGEKEGREGWEQEMVEDEGREGKNGRAGKERRGKERKRESMMG